MAKYSVQKLHARILEEFGKITVFIARQVSFDPIISVSFSNLDWVLQSGFIFLSFLVTP